MSGLRDGDTAREDRSVTPIPPLAAARVKGGRPIRSADDGLELDQRRVQRGRVHQLAGVAAMAIDSRCSEPS